MSKEQAEVPEIFAGFVTETYEDGELVDSHGEIDARKDPDWPQFTENDASDEDEGDDDDQDVSDDDNEDDVDEDEGEADDDDQDVSDDDDGDEDDDGDDGAADNDASDDDADREKPKRRKKSARQRIAELTARAKAAEERASAAEAAALKTNDDTDDAGDTRPERDTADEVDLSDLEKPDPAKYHFGEIDAKYMEDMATYNVEVAGRKREAKQAKVQAEKDAKAAQAAATAQLEKNFLDNVVTPGQDKFDDFDAVVIEGGKAGKYQLTPTLVSLISESEKGAEIMYHFASNPTEASKVANMSVERQAAYFGRMEARFDTSGNADAGKKSRAKPTKAPKPGRRRARGSGAGKRTNPATTDFKAFESMVRSKG